MRDRKGGTKRVPRWTKVPRLKVQRNQESKGLLEDKEEADTGTPPAAEPTTAELALRAVTAQDRDVAPAVNQGERSESDDPGLPLEIGVGLGEIYGLFVRRRAIAVSLRPGEHVFAPHLLVEVLHVKAPLTGSAVDLSPHGLVVFPRAGSVEEIARPVENRSVQLLELGELVGDVDNEVLHRPANELRHRIRFHIEISHDDDLPFAAPLDQS